MVEERVGMEVSYNGREMFTVGNEDEAAKIISRVGDDEKVKEGIIGVGIGIVTWEVNKEEEMY